MNFAYLNYVTPGIFNHYYTVPHIQSGVGVACRTCTAATHRHCSPRHKKHVALVWFGFAQRQPACAAALGTNSTWYRFGLDLHSGNPLALQP